MKRIAGLYIASLVAAGLPGMSLGPWMTSDHTESDDWVEHVTRSPDGTFRVEQTVGNDHTTTAWIIPTTEPAKRVALGEPFDSAFGRRLFISPDGRWICAVVHHHSQLDGVML